MLVIEELSQWYQRQRFVMQFPYSNLFCCNANTVCCIAIHGLLPPCNHLMSPWQPNFATKESCVVLLRMLCSQWPQLGYAADSPCQPLKNLQPSLSLSDYCWIEASPLLEYPWQSEHRCVYGQSYSVASSILSHVFKIATTVNSHYQS